MREPSPKTIIFIPSERRAETAFRDQPLAVLNEMGRMLIESSPPRSWDGATISLAGFRLS